MENATDPLKASLIPYPHYSVLKHTAEDLDFLDDASIDLVISG